MRCSSLVTIALASALVCPALAQAQPALRFVAWYGSDTVLFPLIGPNTCTSLVWPCKDLEWAITHTPAGGTLWMVAPQGTAPFVASNIAISKDITLLGKAMFGDVEPIRVVAGTGTRHFDITSGRVNMEHLALSGGQSTDGGSVRNAGTLTVKGSRFLDNQASSNGGAIFNDGDLTLDDVYMEGNVAVVRGGGIFNNEGAELFVNKGTALRANSAHDGGAIASIGRKVTLSGAPWLLGNSASKDGGALHLEGGETTIGPGASVAGNDAEADGGGLFVAGANTKLVLDAAVVHNNHAGDEGGGVAVRDQASLTMAYGAVSANSANLGGGLSHQSTVPASVYGSTFSTNVATANGGAVHVGSGADLQVLNSTFSQNRAANGGVIFNLGNSNLRFTTHYGNVATNGAATIHNSLTLSLDNSVIDASRDVAGNPSAACGGADLTGGGNFVGTAAAAITDKSCSAAATFNRGYPAGLDPVLQNQSPTDLTATHAVSGTTIVNAVSCFAGGGLVTVDQRRAPRPVGASCDAGSVERQ